jgi:hypothetical protein
MYPDLVGYKINAKTTVPTGSPKPSSVDEKKVFFLFSDSFGEPEISGFH